MGIVEISPIDGKPLMVWGIGFTTLRKYHYPSVPGISSLTINTCGKTRDNQPILDFWFSRVKVWAGFGDTPVVIRCQDEPHRHRQRSRSSPSPIRYPPGVTRRLGEHG